MYPLGLSVLRRVKCVLNLSVVLHQEFVLMKRRVSHPRQRVTSVRDQEQHVQQQAERSTTTVITCTYLYQC